MRAKWDFIEIVLLQIGLMRSGRLLAEESPQTLLTMYRCSNLEDVFLKLSRKQGASNNELAELNIRYVFVFGWL